MARPLQNDSIEEEAGLPCRAKLGYDTQAATRAAISYAVWQYGGKDSDYQSYVCKYCNRWHIARSNDKS